MPTFKKNILKVGTYHSPDGKVEVTPERLKHWSDQFGKMIKKYVVPVGFNHGDDTLPVPISEAGKLSDVRDNAGYLKSFEVAADGQSAVLELDIPRAEDADKIGKTIRDISPIIYPSVEVVKGDGEVWKDVITHVDLVNNPVDNTQGEFRQVNEIACSLRMSTTVGKKTGKPVVYRFGDVEQGNPDIVKQAGPETKQQFDAILAILSEMGIELPANTDESNFRELLLTALKTHVATADKKDSEMATQKDDDQQAVEDKADFAGLSVDGRNRIKAAESKAAASHAVAQETVRLSLDAKLTALLTSGRATPDEVNTRREGLSSFKLSLDGEGNIAKGSTEEWIQSRDTLPRGAVWSPDEKLTKMSAEVENPPGHLNADDDADSPDAAADSLFPRQAEAMKKLQDA
tara:strand:- start:15679 stop:16887 length:1209 start_codon:yes stop_codon:yes gene_type:complete